MSLKEMLVADMKEAMKAKEVGKLKLSVIRLVKAAIQNEEIDKGHELSDEEVIDVMARELKKRKDVLPDYQKSGRDDAVSQLQEEMSILQTYLPQQFTEEEIRLMVQEAIQQTGAQGPKDMGKVMKEVIQKTKGRADGKIVNNLVKELLE
ncbi:MAG: GatB/YqeY domain-containing protein [Acidobacteriota bacterium]